MAVDNLWYNFKVVELPQSLYGHFQLCLFAASQGEKLVRAAASKAPTIVLLQIPGAVESWDRLDPLDRLDRLDFDAGHTNDTKCTRYTRYSKSKASGQPCWLKVSASWREFERSPSNINIHQPGFGSGSSWLIPLPPILNTPLIGQIAISWLYC